MSFHFDDVMRPTRVATEEEILALRQEFGTTSVENYKNKGQKAFDFSSEMSFENTDKDWSQSVVVTTSTDDLFLSSYVPIVVGESDIYVASHAKVMVA